jgi:hypothetical protein
MLCVSSCGSVSARESRYTAAGVSAIPYLAIAHDVTQDKRAIALQQVDHIRPACAPNLANDVYRRVRWCTCSLASSINKVFCLSSFENRDIIIQNHLYSRRQSCYSSVYHIDHVQLEALWTNWIN